MENRETTEGCDDCGLASAKPAGQEPLEAGKILEAATLDLEQKAYDAGGNPLLEKLGMSFGILRRASARIKREAAFLPAEDSALVNDALEAIQRHIDNELENKRRRARFDERAAWFAQRATMTTVQLRQEEPMLQFFATGHLPPELAAVAGSIAMMAYDIVRGIPRNPERTVALRKLLEAKDCAVRAVIYE